MKIILLISLLVMLTGCDFIAPNVSKARTEKVQSVLLKRQVEALEKIADYLVPK